MKFHNFNTNIAKEYGIAEAVFINNLQHWIEKNRANNKHFYDDRWWTYNSIPAFAEIFDYLSAPQIKRLIKRLVDKEVIVIGSYNKNPYDHTRWYAFKDQERFLFHNDSSIRRDRPIDETPEYHSSDDIVPSLTDKNTDKNTDVICRVFSQNAHTHIFPPNNESGNGKNYDNKATNVRDEVKSVNTDSKDDCCIIYIMENNDLYSTSETQNETIVNCTSEKNPNIKKHNPQKSKQAKAKASTLPEDWILPYEWKQWALDASGWGSEFIEGQADKFHDHHLSRATKAVSWFASWRYWCRNSAEYKGISLKTKEQIKADTQRAKEPKPQIVQTGIAPELQKKWEIVQDALKERVGDAKFKSWLEHLRPVYPFNENKLTITAPTRFTKEWVFKNYYEDIKAACVKSMGVNDVSFVTRTG